MNGKRYFLVIRKKWKSLLLFLVGGAILAAGIYAISYANLTKTKMYQSEAVFYIEANNEAAYVYYNGFTWREQITFDRIMLPCMEELKKSASVSLTREEIEASVYADVVSDLRLVNVTVTMDSPVKADQAMTGIIAGMEGFAEYVDEFDSITCWSVKPAAEVVHENLIFHAIVLGLVLALILWIIVITVYYAIEDSIYTVNDVKEITDIPVLGIRTKKPNQTLEQMLAENLERVCGSLEVPGEKPEGLCGSTEGAVEKPEQILGYREDILEISVDDESVWNVRDMVGRNVMIFVQYGNHNGKKLALLLHHLSINNIIPCGIVITDADNLFLNSYYKV